MSVSGEGLDITTLRRLQSASEDIRTAVDVFTGLARM